MTNYESTDPDKVKEIFARSFAIDKRTGEIRTCKGLDCADCLFDSDKPYCLAGRMNWIDQPAFDPEKDIDWKRVPINTPVIVWNSDSNQNNRFFAGIDGEYFSAYSNGGTSWSSKGNTYYWNHCKLYRPEDVEKYRKKGTENG